MPLSIWQWDPRNIQGNPTISKVARQNIVHNNYYEAIFTYYRYLNTADEPSPENRIIMFTVSDGNFTGSANLSLSITTVDDNPTTVSTNSN
jgi:hypothetical protein